MKACLSIARKKKTSRTLQEKKTGTRHLRQD